jgi:hypothetical protein
MISPIRAEIVGDRAASAEGITATGAAPVLALCRALVRAGFDPATPLLAYRGDVLSLQVGSIGQGAALTVRESTADGRPRFVPLNGDGEPLVRQKEATATHLAPEPK